MIEGLPFYLPLVFIATTLLALFIFYRATHYSAKALWLIIIWLAVQGIAGYLGFYLDTNTMPPRFALLIGPPLLLIIFLFTAKKGRGFIDGLDARSLTFLHVVRVPVEIVLLGLFLYGQVPQLMTFEGRNLDIVSGITAPLVAFFLYRHPQRNKFVLITWNFICLGLLFNIVIHAILSAPVPFQQMAFDQPNVGVLYFPFVWLPCCVVPLVLFSHLVCLRQLFKTPVKPV